MGFHNFMVTALGPYFAHTTLSIFGVFPCLELVCGLSEGIFFNEVEEP